MPLRKALPLPLPEVMLERAMTFLRKAESREEVSRVPSVWWPAVTDRGSRTAIYSCPGCGERFNLERWLINADGTVVPSVDHSWPIRKNDGTEIPSCRFHDNIQLQGWVA